MSAPVSACCCYCLFVKCYNGQHLGTEQSRYLAALQDTALLDAGLTLLRFVITSLAEDPVSAHAFQTYVETLFSLNDKLTARKRTCF